MSAADPAAPAAVDPDEEELAAAASARASSDDWSATMEIGRASCRERV